MRETPGVDKKPMPARRWLSCCQRVGGWRGPRGAWHAGSRRAGGELGQAGAAARPARGGRCAGLYNAYIIRALLSSCGWEGRPAIED